MSNNQDFILTVKRLTKLAPIRKSTKVQPILSDVSFSASAGEFLSILGVSGSGKSTLLKCLSGLSDFSKGDITIFNKNIKHISKNKLALLRRTKVSFIFQDYNLIPALPAFDNIVLPLLLSHQKIDRQKVNHLMRRLNFNSSLSRFPKSLSGGEQQKVAIARALLTHSSLIFADEPTGALDSTSRQLVFSELQNLASSGACVVMVTHDIELASKTDRSLILRDGKIIHEYLRPSENELLSALHEGE